MMFDSYEELELQITEQVLGKRPAVRHDCAFCGRERSPKDDNHAPECFYWAIFTLPPEVP